MSFWEQYWPQVAAAATAGLIVAILIAKPTREAVARVLGWLISRPIAVLGWWRQRGRNSARESREARVKAVMDRADVLRLQPPEDVPVKRSGLSPVEITFHPSGRKFYMYPDFTSYRAATAQDPGIARHAKYGTVPQVLGEWSLEQLNEWIRKYKDAVPPRK